ncbi:MAG: YeeE/YedE family protein [Aureispira sp.]|nr:YeeE/YedE family protein [Aureispira sp.]
MKGLKYLVLGTLFGVTMIKSEAASWYRIHEMFRFESFHMFGIIGVAVVLGAILVAIIKKKHLKTLKGTKVPLHPKSMSIPRYLIGGTIFGLGWAMTGACPGPLYALIGQGTWILIVVVISALLGTLVYGALREKLPH